MQRVAVLAAHLGRRAASTASNGLLDAVRADLASMKAAGTYKVERVITSPQGAHVKLGAAGSKSVINFCANNYIGFASHPEV